MRQHAGPLALFAALTVLFTWPLVTQISTAIPGGAGDSLAYLWLQWWMRHVLVTPGASFFRTDYLFFPFGASLVNHTHTALPAFIGATVLRPFSIITAVNTLLLVAVFLNGAVTYGLAWDVTHHRRGSVFAGVLFGASPYIAAHLLGHFDLLSAWVLPAFAWALRRGLDRRSWPAALAAGTVAAITAYSAYYYVVYLLVLAIVFLLSWSGGLSIVWRPRLNPSDRNRTSRRVVGAGAVAAAGLLLWVLTFGVHEIHVGSTRILFDPPQNLMTLVWLLALAWWLMGRHIRVHLVAVPAERWTQIVRVSVLAGAVFFAAAFPLLKMGIELKRSGEYVTQKYFWRSAPKGVDLVNPFLGHPFQSVTGRFSAQAHWAAGSDPIECVAWLGVIPIVLLAATRVTGDSRLEARRWWAVVAVFAVWAAGPSLRVAGHDVGLWLPEVLARYIPFVENARMPGRAMVGVYLGVAMLAAMRFGSLAGRWQRPAVQWAMVGGLVFEFSDAPILTGTLTAAPAIARLTARAPGAVCTAPFGLRDGFGQVGPGELSTIFDATVHEHPVVGGFISRMPARAAERYAAMPVVGRLLALSGGPAASPPATPSTASSPCSYLIVKRRLLSSELREYVATGPFDKVDSDDENEIYRVRR